MKVVFNKILTTIYIFYIELVVRTSKINFNVETELKEKILKNCIVGFWHGDSFAMNIVLKEFREFYKDLRVIVTASERGNYIEGILNNYGANAIRTSDGMGIREFLKSIREIAKKDQTTLCIAIDGPLGPLKEPKKIGLSLCNKSTKPFVGIKFEFSRTIRLKSRWDRYVIPIPFSKIHIDIINFGYISGDNISNFKEFKNIIIEKLN